MARARLHLICGNCGCNDMWTYHIDPEGADRDGEMLPTVYLSCGNCSTLHELSDNATQKKQPSSTSKPIHEEDQ